MKAKPLKITDEALQKWSREFAYPATPDISGEVRRRLQQAPVTKQPVLRRLVWGSVAILLLLAVLMAVPPVRAQVLKFFQIGAIRIVPVPSPVSPQETVQHPSSTQAAITPSPTLKTYPALADLAGETSLIEAQKQLDFPIYLPTYPKDLGQPDRIFLQDLDGPAVLLVWMNPKDRVQIRLSLLLMGSGAFAEKVTSQVILETTVMGQPALWTEGPHFLQLGEKLDRVPLMVRSNVLIWQVGEITYRLESDLTLEEAVRIAESIKANHPAEETSTPVDAAVPGEVEGIAGLLTTATPALNSLPDESCPLTQPQDPPFTPPSPYPAEAPYPGQFWYGSGDLWTALRTAGVWRRLPYHDGHYVQKVFWWNKDYDWQSEPVPEFTVTVRQLGRSTPVFKTSIATNAFHPDFGSAILTGVEIPGLGCWEISGSYKNSTLSFVVWVAP